MSRCGRTLATAVLASMVIGCGGGGSSKGPGACTATGTPGASLSWDDDGTFECAYSVYATNTITQSSTQLSVTAAQPSGLGLGFGVTTQLTSIEGAYTCAPAATVQVSFEYEQASTATFSQDCAISFSSPPDGGSYVTGTFSGVFNLASGATKTVTNGIFDAPVTVITE
jgi:hypothetical protein